MLRIRGAPLTVNCLTTLNHRPVGLCQYSLPSTVPSNTHSACCQAQVSCATCSSKNQLKRLAFYMLAMPLCNDDTTISFLNTIVHLSHILNNNQKRKRSCMKLQYNKFANPHRGLPPCRGGGAYAPMTRTICNLKERS